MEGVPPAPSASMLACSSFVRLSCPYLHRGHPIQMFNVALVLKLSALNVRFPPPSFAAGAPVWGPGPPPGLVCFPTLTPIAQKDTHPLPSFQPQTPPPPAILHLHLCPPPVSPSPL